MAAAAAAARGRRSSPSSSRPPSAPTSPAGLPLGSGAAAGGSHNDLRRRMIQLLALGIMKGNVLADRLGLSVPDLNAFIRDVEVAKYCGAGYELHPSLWREVLVDWQGYTAKEAATAVANKQTAMARGGAGAAGVEPHGGGGGPAGGAATANGRLDMDRHVVQPLTKAELEAELRNSPSRSLSARGRGGGAAGAAGNDEPPIRNDEEDAAARSTFWSLFRLYVTLASKLTEIRDAADVLGKRFRRTAPHSEERAALEKRIRVMVDTKSEVRQQMADRYLATHTELVRLRDRIHAYADGAGSTHGRDG